MKNKYTMLIVFLLIFVSCNKIIHVEQINDIKNSDKTIEIQGVVSDLVTEENLPIGFYLQDSRWNKFSAYFFNSTEKIEKGDKVRFKTSKLNVNNEIIFSKIKDIKKISSNNPIKFKKVYFPLSNTNLKQLENTYVEIQNEMILSDAYNYLKYGVLMVSTEQMIQPTEIYDAQMMKSKIIELNNYQNINSILLDDFSNSKYPDNLYLHPNKIQIGENISGIKGLVSFQNDKICIRISNKLVQKKRYIKNELYKVPEGVKIMFFNVNNLFNGNGLGEGFPTERGARTFSEYQLQLSKISKAIIKVNPDIVALVEIENDHQDKLSCLNQLCNHLNSLSSNKFNICLSNKSPGNDKIKNIILYKNEELKISKKGKYFSDSIFSRAPFFQEFLYQDTIAFVVSVNHFKSKSSRHAKLLNIDQNDGQSSYNHTRLLQSKKLMEIINSNYNKLPLIVLGDFNAYTQEDPIQEISSELNRLPTDAYSYLYKGRLGNLDHAFVNNKMLEKVNFIQTWDINTSSPNWINYKNILSDTTYIRSSDHNPLIIYLY